MPANAIIFDFDGIIIDSETPEFQTWQEIIRDHGFDLPMQEWEKGLGASLQDFDPLVYLETLVDEPINKDSLLQKQRERLMQHILAQPPLPGICEYLASARQAGIKVACASSSPSEWVNGNLDRLGLLPFFDVVCTQEDVTRVKPSPDLYLLASQRLGVPPAEAIAVEDSPNGIRAARAAGLFTVAVPTPISQKLDLSQANLIIASLSHLPFEQFTQLVD